MSSIGFDEDLTSAASVASVRPAKRNELLAMEARGTRTPGSPRGRGSQPNQAWIPVLRQSSLR